MSIVLASIIGAVTRRWHGGWTGWQPEWAKLLVLLGVPAVIAGLSSDDPLATLAASVILAYALLDPFKLDRHSAETFNDVAHSFIYWLVTTAFLGAVFGRLGHGYWYMPIGFAIPIGYVGFKLLDRAVRLPRLNGFFNGYTTYGEAWLGAAIFGSIPLVMQ